MKRVAPPFALLVGILGTVHFLMSGPSPVQTVQRPQLAANVTASDIKSKLGRVGDPVTVDAKVIQVHSASLTVGLATVNGVMVFATFDREMPAAARMHNRVRLEGKVVGVRTEVSVYVTGTKLVLVEA